MLLRRAQRPALVATAAAVLTFGTATVAVAEPVDGHSCQWMFLTAVPNNLSPDRINYTQGVSCDGIVRTITLTTELLYHGPANGPGTTVQGQTVVSNDITSTAIGAYTPGANCESGYYSGRATATVRYRSGTPEYITVTLSSAVVSRSCNPPDIPVPPIPPPSPTPSPRDRFPGGRH